MNFLIHTNKITDELKVFIIPPENTHAYVHVQGIHKRMVRF
jgi:hypothetical protein